MGLDLLNMYHFIELNLRVEEEKQKELKNEKKTERRRKRYVPY